MKTAQQWFDAYGASHRHPVNELIHWVCVPLIVFSTVALLSSLPHSFLRAAEPPWAVGYTHWGTLAVAASLVFYVRMSWTIGLGMLAVSALTLWGVAGLVRWELVGGPATWSISLPVFVSAWLLQVVGHKVEGQRPCFFEDLQFLLIGPAWLLHLLYRRVGIPIEGPRP